MSILHAVAVNEAGRRIGESHHKGCHVSDELVELMRTLRETEGLSIEDIAERVHLPWGTVNKICYYQRRVERRARVKMVRE